MFQMGWFETIQVLDPCLGPMLFDGRKMFFFHRL